MRHRSAFEIAMEGALDGKPHIEKEITCYVKLKDLYDVTSIATDSETHEQWKLKTDSETASMRIRLTDDVEYVLTIKEKTRRQFDTIETEQIITRELFESLKKNFGLDGRLKTRYNIPIPDTDRKWEVDVFKDHRGLPSLWIKLDYEFGDTEQTVPEIPFPYELIYIPELDPTKEAEVAELWDNEWAKIDEAN